MKIGLASENNLPKAYASKTLENGEQVTLQAGSEKLTISTNSFQSVANILSMFAPDGNTTLEPGTTFYIRDGFSEKETSVTANALTDVAAALSLFAVKPGKYIPTMKDDDAKASDQATAGKNPTGKAKGRRKQAKTADDKTTTTEPVTAVENVVQEAVVEAAPGKAERKKPGRKAAVKSEAASTITAPAGKGRKAKEQPAAPAQQEAAPAVAQTQEAPAAAEAPAKRRGRPPKNRAVTDTALKAKPTATSEKKPRAKKTSAPAATATVTPIARVPHSSGGPFPAAMTANHKSAEISADAPGFIKELKAYYIIGDNDDYRFDFTALDMDPAKRRSVLGPSKTQTADSTFGYEVKSKAGEHIGWIIIEAENKFVMAGIPEMDVSSHRNIEGPITKTGIAIANKIASIRAKAA
jgi:hypothetical protein